MKMRATVLRSHGGPEVLSDEELEAPTPGPGEVRVRVRAFATSICHAVRNVSGIAAACSYDSSPG